MRDGIEINPWKRYRLEKGSRYYQLSLRKNLWGDWEVEKVNGRIRSRQRKARYEPCESYEYGVQLLKKYRDYRVIKRHYREDFCGIRSD